MGLGLSPQALGPPNSSGSAAAVEKKVKKNSSASSAAVYTSGGGDKPNKGKKVTYNRVYLEIGYGHDSVIGRFFGGINESCSDGCLSEAEAVCFARVCSFALDAIIGSTKACPVNLAVWVFIPCTGGFRGELFS